MNRLAVRAVAGLEWLADATGDVAAMVALVVAAALLLAGCAATHWVPISPTGPTEVMFVDIDGTVTTNPAAIFAARVDAAKALQLLAHKGYLVVYVSARLDLFDLFTERWLQDNGFPAGPLYTAETLEDQLHPDVFKARVYRDLMARGLKPRLCFGDSTTDFEACGAVGMKREQIYALLREGDADCQPDPRLYLTCVPSWTYEMPFLMALPVVK